MSKKIKLKDLLKENYTGTMMGGVISRNAFGEDMSLYNIVKEKYGEVDDEKVNIKELTNEISSYNEIGEAIFGKSNISKISEKLSWIAKSAKSHTLQETDDWFDKITVNRNMKELTNLSKSFDKISSEANALQQRMGALYEDMGNILGRYYEMDETHVYGHDTDDEMTPEKEDDSETKFKMENGDYEKFFQAAMKKFGIKSPAELDDEKKKDFFNYVDKNYTAKKETD